MNKIVIAPSLLACDFLRLGQEIDKVKAAGVQWLHVDVMDGHFVPNLSIGVPIIKSIEKEYDLPQDVHLMISHPDSFVEPFVEAGAESITFHLEASEDPQSTIDYLQSKGIRVGLSVKPDTPVEVLKPYLERIDMALIMTVEPGFGGQSFRGEMMDKVRTLRQEWGWDGDIQVDGGIDPETAPICARAGANNFVAGSAIFGTDDPGQAVRDIRAAAEGVR